MANEAVKSYATTINHIINGSAVADTAFMPAADIDNQITPTNGLNYPLADLKLSITFATAPDAEGLINVYRRDESSPDPDATYGRVFVGSFVTDAVTSAQVLWLNGVALSPTCDFFLENQAGFAFPATWDLDVLPYTYGTAA